MYTTLLVYTPSMYHLILNTSNSILPLYYTHAPYLLLNLFTLFTPYLPPTIGVIHGEGHAQGRGEAGQRGEA